MNPLKTLSFSACALIGTTSVGSAALNASFNITKEYRQNSSGIPQFRTGSATLSISDGDYALTNCGDNGSPDPFGIDFDIACTRGSNAFIITTNGDPNAYYEIDGVQEANTIEPGYPNLIRLAQRPISDFPDTIGGVGFVSTLVFFDLLGESLREFPLGDYSWTRNYTSRKQMDKEILAEQNYSFYAPARKTLLETGDPKGTRILNFGVQRMVEGYVKTPVEGGFQFINVNSFEDGYAEYDPRVINRFGWRGVNQGTVRAGDRTYVSFKTLDPVDPNADTTDSTIVFPPNGRRMQLDASIVPEYSLPPGFSADFGDAVIFEVTLERFSGIGTGGPSSRIYQLPIKFVNSFPGAMAVAFPANTSASIMAPDADPDGDGISNWIEWLSGTNPNKANAPKTLSALTRVNGSSTKSGEPSSPYWEMSFDRPAGLSQNSPQPLIESSTDLKTWTALPMDGKDTSASGGWKQINEPLAPKIYARSNSEQLGEKRYFRVKFSK